MIQPAIFAIALSSAVDLVLASILGAGVALVLAVTPWFRRVPTAARLAPYVPRNLNRSPASRELGLRTTLEPLLDLAGARLSRLLGVLTDLETRLRRAGRDPDTYKFRLRQVLLSLGALGAAVVAWALMGPPRIIAASMILGAPVLALLWSENSLARAAKEREQRLLAELPVVLEQLGMLVSAGYSLTSAISHLAVRGSGVAADDFAEISAEIRRGVPPTDSFSEWARLSGLPSVERVVAVLSLNSEASDLGSLVSGEARTIRSEAHRELLETIERRAQLVWIPVTLATLVPGLIFLAVPFYSAMAKITGG